MRLPQDTGRGPYPWPFGRDPNSSVTRRDSEWPTERKCLGYVCNPHSLKEGTETSCTLAMAGSPAWLLSENLNMCCTCCLFILMLWSATVGSNNLMPMCIGSFSYTRSGLVSISEIPIRRSPYVTSPFPPSRNEGYIRNQDIHWE